MGVLERCYHIDHGVRAIRISIGHLQNDVHLGLLVLGDLRNEKVGTGTVAELTGIMVGLNGVVRLMSAAGVEDVLEWVVRGWLACSRQRSAGTARPRN
jgi:hypothetical protein